MGQDEMPCIHELGIEQTIGQGVTPEDKLKYSVRAENKSKHYNIKYSFVKLT